MTAERYRSWLMLLVNGNQNMVRVWGGGIYENDDFYAICDGMHKYTYQFIFWLIPKHYTELGSGWYFK